MLTRDVTKKKITTSSLVKYKNCEILYLTEYNRWAEGRSFVISDLTLVR